jgi:hypothetical protein
MTIGNKINELLSGKGPQKQRVNIYVTTENYENFRKLCESKGLSVSETVDALMSDFIAHFNTPKVVEISQIPKNLTVSGTPK